MYIDLGNVSDDVVPSNRVIIHIVADIGCFGFRRALSCLNLKRREHEVFLFRLKDESLPACISEYGHALTNIGKPFGRYG